MTSRFPMPFDHLDTIPAYEEEHQGDKLYRLQDVAAMLGLTWDEVNRPDGPIDTVLVDELLFASLVSEDGPEVFVTVAGLCSLALIANTKVAEMFRRWVAIEVLPSIVATGGYLDAAPREEDPALVSRLAATTAWAIQRAVREERQGQALYLPI